MTMWIFSAYILFLLPYEICCGESVNQTVASITAYEGQTVTLDCRYDTSGYPNLFWYVQDLHRHPEFLLQEISQPENYPARIRGRASVVLHKGNKSFPLTLSRLSLSDSAVYFCALSGSSAYKLTFGEGTRLFVEQTLPDRSPSLYVLRPKKENRSKVSPVCLVTDFSPREIDVSINEHHLNESDASVLIQDRSYGVVGYLNQREKHFSCNATHKGITVSVEDENLPDLPDLPDEENTCVNLDVFETDEKLNFLSLSVLGLRIIFLKSIIFNVLMTVHAMSS